MIYVAGIIPLVVHYSHKYIVKMDYGGKRI